MTQKRKKRESSIPNKDEGSNACNSDGSKSLKKWNPKGDSTRKTAEFLQTYKLFGGNRQKAKSSLNIPRTTEWRYYNALKKRGYIAENGMITRRGREFLLTCAKVEQKWNMPVSLHWVAVTFRIRESPERWERMQQRVMKICRFREWSMRNWTAREFVLDEWKVRTSPSSVTFYVEEILAESLMPAHMEFLSVVDRFVPKIEQLFKVQLERKPWRVWCKINGQHIAFIQDRLAAWCVEHEIDLKVYNEQGETIIWVDQSHGPGELEFGSSRNGVEHAEHYERLLEDLVLRNPGVTFSSVREEIREVRQSVVVLAPARSARYLIKEFPADLLRPEVQDLVTLMSPVEKGEFWSWIFERFGC